MNNFTMKMSTTGFGKVRGRDAAGDTGRNVRVTAVFFAFVAVLVWGGCEETISGTDIDLPYRREVVVQGFLTAGEVDTIYIFQTLHPLEPWTMEKGAITDADAVVTVDGVEHRLVHIEGGKYLPDGWVPEAGKEYRLRVQSGEDVVTAVANVPEVHDRASEVVIDTVPGNCTTYDWETGEEIIVDLVRLVINISAPESARFQARYDMVQRIEVAGDTVAVRSDDLRAEYYEYPGNGTARVILMSSCDYQGSVDYRGRLDGIDSLYIHLFEFEPAYGRFHDTRWGNNDDEFFGPSGEEPEWNVTGDGFGWFFGRSVSHDTITLR